MTDLSIIIVSWNVRKHLERCLASIAEAVRGVSFEVFVVDNASTDGTAEFLRNFQFLRQRRIRLRRTISNFQFILNNKNVGFAKANNQAIRNARGKYILLLNPDTEFVPQGVLPPADLAVLTSVPRGKDFPPASPLVPLLEFMDSHPRCGILGPKLVNSDGTVQPSVRRFPRALDPLLFSLGMAHQYLARDFDYTKAQQVDQVMGAAFLIRRSMCDAIGMLDERFFIWFEEVDYCKRAKDAGWEVWYTPDAIVLHHGGESFAQVLTIKKQWMYMKSLLYYFQKYAQWWAYGINFFTLPFRLILALAREIASLSRRQRRDSSQ